MIQRDRFEEAVARSGLKLRFIAGKVGISYQTFMNKRNGLTDFTISEAQTLSDVLGMTAEDRESIFFPDQGDK